MIDSIMVLITLTHEFKYTTYHLRNNTLINSDVSTTYTDVRIFYRYLTF